MESRLAASPHLCKRQKGMKKLFYDEESTQDATPCLAMMIHIIAEEVLVFITNKGVSHAKYNKKI